MANSAIRIPIPGSIINAPSAQDGDMLFFDPLFGNGGAFVNFKPLIQDLRPFTKESRLDFFVSIADSTETTTWDVATARGASLIAATNPIGTPNPDDIKFGVNLGAADPNSNLEVGGDLFVWGRGNIGGGIIGSLAFYSFNAESPGPTWNNTTWFSPYRYLDRTNNTDQAVLAGLRSTGEIYRGDLLVRSLDSKQTFFVQLDQIAVAGNGINITGNTIEAGSFSELSSNTGVTVRIDANNDTREDYFRVVEKVTSGDYPLMSISRAHGQVIEWDATTSSFLPGVASNQTWPVPKIGIGTGRRLLPAGIVMEDGFNVTGNFGDFPTDATGLSTHHARLFGPVAHDPLDIVITGTAGNSASANYFDLDANASINTTESNGRFGFLMGVVGMTGGIANPGSFVAGFLSKHNDGGGIKIKSGDANNDEFSLFIENSLITGPDYDPTTSTGADGGLNGRSFSIFSNPSSATTNGQYRNILASHAPVFTVRATSGDTFIRGFLTMPFMPGINATWDGTISGATITQPDINNINGTNPPLGFRFYGVYRDTATNEIYVRQYEKQTVAGNPAWVQIGSYKLPKGTVYSTSDGTIKIAKGGNHIPNHGLDGVSNWQLSQ